MCSLPEYCICISCATADKRAFSETIAMHAEYTAQAFELSEPDSISHSTFLGLPAAVQ
jgi:hypothetical protein